MIKKGQRYLYDDLVIEVVDASRLSSVICKVVQVIKGNHFVIDQQISKCFSCCYASKAYLPGQDKL